MEQIWNKRNKLLFWKAPKLLKGLERETGLEPVTSSLGSWHSTTELLPPDTPR